MKTPIVQRDRVRPHASKALARAWTTAASMLFAVILAYGMAWLLASSSGFYRSKLQAELVNLQNQRNELDAERQRLRAAPRVLAAAANNGMKPVGTQEEFSGTSRESPDRPNPVLR